MEKVDPKTAAEAAVIIIDQNKLRRASVVNFLRAWADSLEASLIGLCLAVTPKDLEIGCECRLVVLNLGGSRIDSPDVRSLLDTLYATLPQVPVVLFSDLEDPDEVVAAFRAGINSFIPASIEPELVPQTLTFIIGGGSYFPPSALLELRREPNPGDGAGAAGDDEHLINGLSPADIDLQGARAGQLTSRQLDVLALLRQGKSNKMIARDLGMREATVKVHVRQILRKLGASNRTQAALSMLEGSTEARSLGGGIKAVALPGFESGEMEAEKASLFTKGIVIGQQLVIGIFAGAVSLVESDVLEMMAAAPSYIALLT